MHHTSEKILFSSHVNRTRVAALDAHRILTHYDEESLSSKMEKNSIYNGEIRSLRPELNAVFVRYDKDKKDGFLPFDNIAPEFYANKSSGEDGKPDMTKCLKVGQKLVVQVKKDQLSHDSKGAALTTYLSLAGTYLVLLPHNNKQGISRKADSQQRDQVRDLLAELNPPENIGLIIRTAGIDRTVDELKWDFSALMRQYDTVMRAAKDSATPALIHEEDNIISRNIRDNISPSTKKIITDSPDIFKQIQTYLSNTRPDILEGDILELYTHNNPLYEHYGIESQVENIFNTSIKLPSGGYIVVHGTEAGYMIDVNSGKSTSGKSIDETALNTNLEAARAACQILKLRDVGGIIVIDFIDMAERDHQKQVEQVVAQTVSTDRAKIKFETISALTGCMFMLRQRLGVPFFESSLTTDENSDYILMGKKRSVESYANYILHIIANTAIHNTDIIQIQTSCAVATYLLNEHRQYIANICAKHNVDVKIIPNENIKTHRYTMKRFRLDNAAEALELPKSHEQIIHNDADKPWLPNHTASPQAATKSSRYQHDGEAATRPARETTPRSSGILMRIWSSLFGKSNTRPSNEQAKKPSHRRNTRSRTPRSGQQQSSHHGGENYGRSSEHNKDRGNRSGGSRRRPMRRRSNNHQNQTQTASSISHFQDD